MWRPFGRRESDRDALAGQDSREVISRQDQTSNSQKRSMAAAQVKQSKQERVQARNQQYLLTTKDFRERLLKPLSEQAASLFELARAMGSGKALQGASGDAQLDTMGKQFNKFLELHQRKIAALANYHSALYKIAGKRADTARNGGLGKARPSVMHRSISNFQTPLYDFIKEASASNEALRLAANCATFDPSSPLFGYMSPTYAAQFILAYAASNRCFNPTNGQYIQPDALMKKHLGASIEQVLRSVAESGKKKDVENAKRFPGQFTFCKLQELIKFYRVKPEENSAADAKVKAIRKEKTLWPVLQVEYDQLCEVRAAAFKRLREERKKPETVAGEKRGRGQHGPLSEAQKRARALKRAATAAQRTLKVKVTLTPVADEQQEAVPPVSATA